jgi:uncharacterized YigZ family protein
VADYLTIEAPAQASIREKMSRFIAFAAPVSTVEQAREFIAQTANRYHDARHVCWAYMIGADRQTWQLNDNGEPSGTAGKPILGQINSLGLTDVVVAVVRYFGGIKLGTPGLIQAYRTAARQALEAASIVKRSEMTTVDITFPYQAINDVMKIVKQPGITVVSQTLDNSCSMTLSLPLDRAPEIRQRLDKVIAPQ